MVSCGKPWEYHGFILEVTYYDPCGSDEKITTMYMDEYV